MKQSQFNQFALLAATCMTLLCPAASHAADPVPILLASDGYLRAGPGLSKKGQNRSCYRLPGAEFKYRLGNECDFYGEFGFGATVNRDGNQQFKVYFMPNLQNPSGSDDGGSKFGIAQMYLEGKGLDFAPEVTFWGGKRYNRGADIHIIDTKFEQMDGSGAGANMPLLGGVFEVAFYRSDSNGLAATDPAYVGPGNRLNLWIRDVPVNAGGTLTAVAGLTKGDFEGGKSGGNVSARHRQKFGTQTYNDLFLSVAQGSGALNGNFGTLTDGSDVKKWRLMDGFTWQATRDFSGQAIAMLEKVKANTGNLTITSLGGRAVYALAKNFKLQGELGIDRVKPDGGAARNLTKFTFAPTITADRGFWARPELRFYVTHARWNDAANAAAAGGLTGFGDAKTSGTSYGVQAEVWW
jgi:maltoporin